MPYIIRSAKKATGLFFALSAMFLFLMLIIPGSFIIGLIVVMIPLGYLSDLGISGLGHENNGFFIPTGIGFVLGALIIWLGLFLMQLVFGWMDN